VSSYHNPQRIRLSKFREKYGWPKIYFWTWAYVSRSQISSHAVACMNTKMFNKRHMNKRFVGRPKCRPTSATDLNSDKKSLSKTCLYNEAVQAIYKLPFTSFLQNEWFYNCYRFFSYLKTLPRCLPRVPLPSAT
jgi:hypothetical protein